MYPGYRPHVLALGLNSQYVNVLLRLAALILLVVSLKSQRRYQIVTWLNTASSFSFPLKRAASHRQ